MVKQEYHNITQQGNYSVEIDFNYNFACCVIVKHLPTNNFLGWGQYENCIFYGTQDIEQETLNLSKTENLVPDLEEVKQKITMFKLPPQFSVDILLQNIKQVSKDIENNYPKYWANWRKEHLNK